MDFGGTKVALRLVNGVQQDAYIPWERSAEPADDLRLVADHVQRLRQRCEEPIAAVGVATAATVDAAGRVTAWPTRPSWVGLELRDRLSELVAGPVRLADDGTLAALAEAEDAGRADLAYLGVGTGVGGGLVLGGRPLTGPDGTAGEVGHMVIDRRGPVCACGRIGCVQAVASGRATLNRAAVRRGATVSLDELREGYRAGVEWAVETVAETCDALAAAITGICELVRPELVRIGGGFAAGLGDLVPGVETRVETLSRPGHPPVPIEPAGLGAHSSLSGAVLLAATPDPQDRPGLGMTRWWR